MSQQTDSPTHWGLVFFALSLGWLAAYQYFKLPPAIPLLLDKYQYDRLFVGMLMGVFAFAGWLLSAWVGKRVLSVGFQGLLTGAFVLSAAGSLISLFGAPSAAVMMTGRLAEALAYAVLSVLGPLLVTEAASPRNRPLATALFASWIPVGQLLASGIAAAALPRGYWQSLWWLALVGIGAMALWSRHLSPDLRARWQRGTEDTAGSSTRAGTDRSRRTSAWLAGALFGLWSGQYIAYMTWLPQFLNDDWELDARQIALSYAIVPAMVIAFNVVAGWLMRRGVSLMTILLPALMVQTLIWIVMPYIGTPWAGISALLVYGLVSGLIPACLFSLPATMVHTSSDRARTFGIMLSGRNLGALAGPVLLPTILVLTADKWSWVPWVFAAWMAAAVAIAVALARRLHG